MPGLIDLRSDTVTKPSKAMRRAMYEAEVGDDWYGDDPTVNILQERAAEVMGKEAALYVVTGTMANEIALHVLARSGHLVVCEAHSHVTGVEATSAAAMSGISYLPVHGPRCRLTAEMVAAALEPDPYDVALVDVVSLENSHNTGGGSVMPLEEMRAIRKVAESAGLPVYLDGARIFNASAASGTPVREFAAEADALMFCLSKGLGAPIGSVLCGSTDFVAEARRAKILFGAAWRQAGVLAAAGLVALEEGPAHLPLDHENARRLAEAIAETGPGSIDPGGVETNILYVDPAPFGIGAWELAERLKDAGVLSTVLGGKVRQVTHRDVTVEDIDRTGEAWRRVAAGLRGGER
jgi:threonine aldolase